MNISQYFTENMIDTQLLSNSELSTIISFFGYSGIENKLYNVESFRHPEFHYLTATNNGNSIMKCSKIKNDRVIVGREQFIKDLKLAEYSDIFKSKVLVNDNEKVLNVFCSGAPNYFIFGVENDTYSTYSFISNQYWIRSSSNLTQPQIDDMILVDVGATVFVN